jgi:hypothetical protein
VAYLNLKFGILPTIKSLITSETSGNWGTFSSVCSSIAKGDRMKKPILIVMAFLLAACASVNVLGSRSEIDQNHEKWQDAGISHYRYNLTISCFCIFTQDMPLLIEVQDGKVLSMEFQSGKEIDPSLHELFDKYATIERVFAELKTGLNGGADNVVVKYDPTNGFPTEATIDFKQQAADDEIYLTLSNFEKLP